MRKPAVAGQFYPGRKRDLLEIVEASYYDRLGPGKMPPKKVSRGGGKIKGMVVPHAGLVFSGPCAAHTYRKLALSGLPESYIVIGPNHHGMGSRVAVSLEDWDMPFGKVSVDKKLGKTLVGDVASCDEGAHAFEHSVEVQMPFLQHLDKELSVVPVVMTRQDWDTTRNFGEVLSKATKGKDVVIIAASDFSHVGINFSMPIPRGMDAGEYAKKLDDMAIEQILNMDPRGLVNTVKKHRITMCGYGPVAATMIASMNNGATKARLLKYYSSHDVMPGNSAVGYGAIVFQ